MRETFDARGTVRYDGPFRQWTNGNLQALLEPTETGHRIRLQTVNGNARASMSGGLAVLGVAAALLLVSAVTGKIVDPGLLSSVGLLSTIGLGMFGIGALRLPGWARLRRRQMEAVTARLALATQSPPPEDPSSEDNRAS